MKNVKRISLILAVLMLLGVSAAFVGCGGPVEEPVDTAAPQGTGTGAVVETEEVYDPFEDVDYEGRPFRVYTSINVASTGMGNSNYLIEGTGVTDGGFVNDAVLERNVTVEEALGVTLEFTQVDVGFGNVAGTFRRLNSSGTNEFDLVINDLFPFASMALEGNFRNTLDPECVFDFSQNYWYGDYMADLRVIDGYQHLLAGDYFIDVMRSAHLLLLNKDIYMDYNQREADELYDVVTNFEWTYEKMNSLITDVYKDLNQNNKVDKGDMFGYMNCEYWGGSIAHTISGNPTFITRNENGVPSIVLDEGDRANQLVDAMTELFHNDCSSIGQTTEREILNAFVEGQCLIVGYQRLGSLENAILRGMEGDVCVLPYPMLFASDRKYTTSTHDTTEVGAILASSTDLEFISTVIEVLNRETAALLIPRYYKEALQVQCVDDPKSAAMIDIIHDNFDNSFALAYNDTLGNAMLLAFSNAIQMDREFSVAYKSSSDRVKSKLVSKLEKYFEKIDAER